MSNLREIDLVSGAPQNTGRVSTLDALLDSLGLEATQAQILAELQQVIISDVIGKLVTLPYSNSDNMVSGTTLSALTTTNPASLLDDPGAGLRNYVTTLIVSNSDPLVSTNLVIQDGEAGATLMTIPAAAVFGGAVISLPVPLRQPTAHQALFCACSTAGASVKVSAVGYKGS